MFRYKVLRDAIGQIICLSSSALFAGPLSIIAITKTIRVRRERRTKKKIDTIVDIFAKVPDNSALV